MTRSRKERLQAATAYTDCDAIARAVALAKRGDGEGRVQMAAAAAWVAYACPAASVAVWDNIAAAWLGAGPTPDIPDDLPQAPLEQDFWDAFWAVVDGYDDGYDATSITVAVASLGAAVHPSYVDLANDHACRHPGAMQAIQNEVPGYTDIDALAGCPPGSLGQALHTMLVENGYDPEVLDRESIALRELPHALHYLNARILQMHDVWHLAAGYETTSSHEIAISAFQLAQFGHNYSAMFLAAVMSMSCIKEPRGFNVLMQIITEAWQHGRNTPAMMDVPWEREWQHSLVEVRQRYKIPVYESVFPVDLLEAAENGSVWRKLRLLFTVGRYERQLRRAAA